MSLKLKRVLAVLVLIALVFGWYVTLFGIGDKTKDDAITSVKSALKYGLDIDGGVYVVMEAKTDLTGDELKKLMEQTRAVLDNRVNQMGVAESSVTIEGSKRLRVEIPGMEDAEDAIKAALIDYYKRQGIDPKPIVGFDSVAEMECCHGDLHEGCQHA